MRYDYMSNVFVLRRALELAGHEVDHRAVRIETEPCIEEDYDAAVVGIAACQGMASRFKLGALWTLHKFGKRAGIFPSDGRNVATFPSSVRTCLTGKHGDGMDPIDYFLRGLYKNEAGIPVLDHEFGANLREVWREILGRLPHSDTSPKCDWPVLVPTFSWGDAGIYKRHFGGPVTVWDPTQIAIGMQFGWMPISVPPDPKKLWMAQDGRLSEISTGYRAPSDRERAWVLSTLQDQDGWLKKQKVTWPVITIGNKRKASAGTGIDFISENDLIREYYTRYWGHLAFGYPLAAGGWWRMRYVHAAKAGCVTCSDPADAMRMPESFKHSRVMLERWPNEKLAEVARDQHSELMAASWPDYKAVDVVNQFVKGLVA